MNRQRRITQLLTTQFNPQRLEVIDESHKHKGHAGARPEGETHFRVEIMSDLFQGKSRVEAHRMVNEALKEEFKTGLHALSIVLLKENCA